MIEPQTTARPESPIERSAPVEPERTIDHRDRIKRIAPAAVAAMFAVIYVLVSPPSLDLAAHLLRAKLFRAEGFGLWNNWWYAGHDVPGYSVLFPPLAAVLSPQLAGALSATATAALFEPLAYSRYGRNA